MRKKAFLDLFDTSFLSDIREESPFFIHSEHLLNISRETAAVRSGKVDNDYDVIDTSEDHGDVRSISEKVRLHPEDARRRVAIAHMLYQETIR